MQYVFVCLITIAFVIAQVLIGGTRLLYSIPAVLVLATAAVLSAWPRLKTSLAARSACLVATTLFCAYLLVRNRLSPVDYLARTDFMILTGSLLVYLLVALFLDRSKYRSWIFFALLALALAHFAIGALQFTQNNHFTLLPWT